MQHLILGYGYCGYYLAQELVKQGQEVTTISRHLAQEMKLEYVQHKILDISNPFEWNKPNTTVYYMIPPPPEGNSDTFLKTVLSQNKIKAKQIIYFGSSAVYGNHHGQWVNEESLCHIENPRQLRRLDAEQQWINYCCKNNIDYTLLRIAGIYGPNRLPIEAAQAKTPLINRNEAPYSNHIYVKDLAAIAYALSLTANTTPILNVADGCPQPMGTLQERVAELLNINDTPFTSWEHAFAKASPMKQEFMRSSKRLNIEALKKRLGTLVKLTALETAIKESISFS